MEFYSLGMRDAVALLAMLAMIARHRAVPEVMEGESLIRKENLVDGAFDYADMFVACRERRRR
jgi:hypothetical protein